MCVGQMVRFIVSLVMTSSVFLFPLESRGADYPSNTVKIIVPFPAGGSTDVLGRILAQKLSEEFKKTFIVENRSGGNTVVAAEYVARSAPDGLTLLLTSSATITMNKSLYSALSYDPVRDFAPVSLVTGQTLLFAVSAKSSFKTLEDMVAFSKANPGKLNVGIGAVVSRVAAEMFKRISGADFVIVPYPGAAPSFQDLLGGNIEVVISDTSSAVPQLQSGLIRALATTGAVRDTSTPQVPTVREAGYPTYDIPSWNGLFAPAATPSDILNKLHSALVKAVAMPDVTARMQKLGLTAATMPPDKFRELVMVESAKWDAMIKEIGLRLQ